MTLLNKDTRGEIHSVAEKADVIFITSNAGSRRANHHHKEFGHWCLVTKGAIIYLERPFGAVGQPTQQTFKPGDLFWTGPLMEHLMMFPEEAAFYCFSVGARDAESYETDTVRMDFQLDEQ